MQISSTYQGTQAGAAVLSGRTPASGGASETGSPGQTVQLTSLAAMAYSHSLAEISCTDDSSTCMFRSADNSLVLQATQHTDVHLRQEHLSLSLTFSAGSLGLTAADFQGQASSGIHLSFSLKGLQFEATHSVQQQVVRPVRQAADVLQDLSQALTQVLKNRGDKSISVILDPEAMQAILGDKKISKLFSELISIIAMLNSLKLEAGPKAKYQIYLSGKGQPYLDSHETTTIDGQENTIDFDLTILPPAAQGEPSSDLEPAETTTK